MLLKKTAYDKLVTKVNNIYTNDFVLKTKYETDKSELENKIPDTTSGLIKKTDNNTKITELENKIPDISNLVTKGVLSSVENKIPDVSNLVNKTDCSTIVTEIENKLNNHNHDKYIDTSEFNKLTADVFNARIAQANLITKTDFDAKLSSFNRKITQNKTKHFFAGNELNKLKTFGKSHFEEDVTQNYLLFQPIIRYFKVNTITNTDCILSWKSKGLSAESIRPPTISDNSFTPELNYYGTKTSVKFNGSCLQQSKISYTHRTIVYIYIVYELGASRSHNNDPTSKNSLFGAVTLTKNANIDKYKYSSYGIGFDRRSNFSFPNGGFGQNVLIFGVDMSFSTHIDNKKEDKLVLGKGPTQGLEDTLTAEKMYVINFTVTKNKFCLSLHYNDADSYLFVNGT